MAISLECTKPFTRTNVFLILVKKNVAGLHETLTSTPANIFGMNFNANYKPGLIGFSVGPH